MVQYCLLFGTSFGASAEDPVFLLSSPKSRWSDDEAESGFIDKGWSGRLTTDSFRHIAAKVGCDRQTARLA